MVSSIDTTHDDFGYEWFEKKINILCNIDLTGYKRPQMERRIRNLMFRLGVENFHDYFRLIERDKEKLRQFTEWVTINVSEFFRDKDRYNFLINEIFPYLIKRFKHLNIWSAGCSNGSEPYSLAIILSEIGHKNYSLTGTDIDEHALALARIAKYKQQDIKNLPENIVQKYFKKEIDERKEDVFVLSEAIKQNVNFKKQNLLYDKFEQGFNFVICRNVVIYFTKETKDVLYNKFMNSLIPDGIFFVGATESLLNYRDYNLARVDTAFYKKIG